MLKQAPQSCPLMIPPFQRSQMGWSLSSCICEWPFMGTAPHLSWFSHLSIGLIPQDTAFNPMLEVSGENLILLFSAEWDLSTFYCPHSQQFDCRSNLQQNWWIFARKWRRDFGKDHSKLLKSSNLWQYFKPVCSWRKYCQGSTLLEWWFQQSANREVNVQTQILWSTWKIIKFDYIVSHITWNHWTSRIENTLSSY